MSSLWDFFYKNSAPAAKGVPTGDGGVDDPDALSTIGAFDVTDKYHASTGQPTDVVLFAVGGAGPVLQIYVFSPSLKQGGGTGWVLLHDNVVPTPTVPARKRLPPYSRCYIRVQTVNSATAIYGGYDVG